MKNTAIHTEIAEGCANYMRSQGFVVPPSLLSNEERTIIAFFRVMRHTIPKQRQRLEKPNLFTYPPCDQGNHLLDWYSFRESVQLGADLTKFRSTLYPRIACAPGIDHLFDEWRIFHFHMNPARRCKHALFTILVQPDNEREFMFALEIGEHGNSTSPAWDAMRLLEIAEDNLPSLLASLIRPEIGKLTPAVQSPQMRVKFRKAGITAIPDYRGASLLPPAFITMDRTSVSDLMQYNKLARAIKNHEGQPSDFQYTTEYSDWTITFPEIGSCIFGFSKNRA